MPSLPPRPPTIPVAPLTGSEWLVARASLAARRTSRFAKLWSLILGPLSLIAFVIPIASSDAVRVDRSARDARVADTLRTWEAMQGAARAAARAESTYADAVQAMRAAATSPAASRAPAAAVAAAPRPALATIDTLAGDSTLRALAVAIAEARRLRTPAAWLALSEQPRVSGGPRMRAVADSLRMLTFQRDELPPSEDRDSLAAPLTRTINRLGYVVVAIAANRYADFAVAAGVVAPAPAATDPSAAPVTESGPAPAPSAGERRGNVARAALPDTGELGAQVRGMRDTLVRAQRLHADAKAALARTVNIETTAAGPTLMAATPAIALLALLLIGIIVRFAGALSHELKAPTLAHARETERAIGAPVLATVKEAWLDGPARFKPGGVDPFRMIYLGLTRTGTRARTLIVTGDDPVIVSAVGARLAISAAADHRTTLAIDLDPAGIGLSRTFRERAEPGLTDALAGSFTWKEVARPVGSSDGLPITLVPAGTERDDIPTGEAFDARRAELIKFRDAFELTILVAPRQHLARAVQLVESSPAVMAAIVGETPVAAFAEDGASVKKAAHRLHGTVLWDAPHPALPSRAELAALLSKQKGRTPGGSFAAVQRAIGAIQKNQ